MLAQLGERPESSAAMRRAMLRATEYVVFHQSPATH
jgi:hypothetical protein